jgi:hypothetical protein
LPARAPPETLAAVVVDSPPPPLPRRREAVQDLRLEVSYAPAPLVIEFVHRRNRVTSSEFLTRAAASTGRPATSPPQPPPLDASPACVLRIDAIRAPNRAPKP